MPGEHHSSSRAAAGTPERLSSLGMGCVISFRHTLRATRFHRSKRKAPSPSVGRCAGSPCTQLRRAALAVPLPRCAEAPAEARRTCGIDLVLLPRRLHGAVDGGAGGAGAERRVAKVGEDAGLQVRLAALALQAQAVEDLQPPHRAGARAPGRDSAGPGRYGEALHCARSPCSPRQSAYQAPLRTACLLLRIKLPCTL